LSKLLYKIYLTYRQTKRNDKSSLLELKTMSKNIGLKNKMRFVYKDSQKKLETFMFQHNQNWLLSSELEGKIYCYTPFWNEQLCNKIHICHSLIKNMVMQCCSKVKFIGG